MAHKLPGLLHRVLDGEGGESRLLFPGTFSVSGRNWRCNGEPRTSSLKDGAWWPQLSGCFLHLQLNTKGRDGNAQSLPEDGGARPRAAPERVAAQAQPPPAAARSKAQLRSEVGRGWEGKGSQAHPGVQSCPHSTPGLQRRGRVAISSRGTGFGDSALSVFHTCPLPPTNWRSLAFPRPAPEAGSSQGLSSGSAPHPHQGWRGYGEPRASPAPSPPVGQRVPG